MVHGNRPGRATPAPLVGLLGGVAAGKSTVARLLVQEGGARLIDADRIARQVTGRRDLARRIEAELGPGILDREGRLDREALAARVFRDEAARKRLEALTHPLILAEVDRLIRDYSRTPGLIVLDAPLLLESGLDRRCHILVFVRADVSIRDERGRERGWAAGEVARREENQIKIENKETAADYCLDNSGSLDTTRARVRGLLRWMGKPGA